MSRTGRDYLVLAAEHLEVLHRGLSQGSVDDQLVFDAAGHEGVSRTWDSFGFVIGE